MANRIEIVRLANYYIDREARRAMTPIAKEISRTMKAHKEAYDKQDYLQIEMIYQKHQKNIEKILVPLWERAARLFFKKPKKLKTLQAKSVIFESYIEDWLKNYAYDRIVGITMTTRNQMRNILLAGLEEGLGTLEIAQRIEEAIPILSSVRAHVISRTETHAAANFGSVSGAREDGMKIKEWISAADERTRTTPPDEFDHLAADGQKVEIDQSFDVSGEELMYPGDPAGSPGNIIMCRCTVGYEG